MSVAGGPVGHLPGNRAALCHRTGYLQMKLKIALASATALGLVSSAAFAGDANISNVYQNGERNALSVEQNGSNNIAGKGSQFGVPNLSGSRLYQGQGPSNPITGNDNRMTVVQNGDFNRVGVEESGNTNGAYIGQLRNQNVLVISQTTAEGGTFATNGNTVLRISQNVGSAAQVAVNALGTNILTLSQTNGGSGFATHYFGQVGQSFSVRNARPNVANVHQEGSQDASAPRSGNRVNFLNQSGSDNYVDVVQRGAGVGGRGAFNVLHQIGQSGNGHEIDVKQDGANNHLHYLTQNGGNYSSAVITLLGNENGAAIGGGRGSFTAGRAAAAVGIGSNYVSGVFQQGSNHAVEYAVFGGNNNQFGFEQRGAGNEAIDILVTGNRNELAVYQNGTDNGLGLSTIAGNDNIIGLRQEGAGNFADINVSGDRNVGFNGFTTGPAATLAGALNLAPGLLKQLGDNNTATLTVNVGNDNVFASLQDGDGNRFTATQSGSSNQATIAQQGNLNVANLTQLGISNSVSISQ